MRWNREMPQDRGGHDVPVIYGDTRRNPFDARPRTNPVRSVDDRLDTRGVRRRFRARGARLVPVVQGVQERVSVVSGYGGVPRRILLELLSASSASAVVGIFRPIERSGAARVVRAVAGQRSVACAVDGGSGQESARDSSGARIAALRA